jgi:hypothetical protein
MGGSPVWTATPAVHWLALNINLGTRTVPYNRPRSGCSRLSGHVLFPYWPEVMSTPEEYRMYARESMQSAAKAKTEAEREAFLQMAHTWEQAALQLEGCIGSPPTAPITATKR